MTGPDPTDVDTAGADAHRGGWALVLAATVRIAGDLDLAEECAQEAYAAALWPSLVVALNRTGTRTYRRSGRISCSGWDGPPNPRSPTGRRCG